MGRGSSGWSVGRFGDGNGGGSGMDVVEVAGMSGIGLFDARRVDRRQ
jgi:hypothetical protein